MLLDHAEWAALAEPDRAVPTAGVWQAHFASWAPAQADRAHQAASRAFADEAARFIDEHQAALADERRELEQWLRLRSRALCGAPDAAPVRDLFASAEPAPAAPAAWRAMDDGRERLIAFADDKSVPAAQRSQAQAILHIHAERRDDLDRRAALDDPAVMPLGLLMLVPA